MQPRVGRLVAAPFRMRRLPRFPAAVDDERIAGLDRHAMGGGDLFELLAVHRRLERNAGNAAMLRHVEQHAAGGDAVAPVLDCAEARAVTGYLLRRIAAVPHAVVVPDMAQRIDVRGHPAVILDAVVIDGAATAGTRAGAREVRRRVRVAGARACRDIAAERDAATAAHELRGRDALLPCDEVHRAALIVIAPAPPVAPIVEVGFDLFFRWDLVLLRRHFGLRANCSVPVSRLGLHRLKHLGVLASGACSRGASALDRYTLPAPGP